MVLLRRVVFLWLALGGGAALAQQPCPCPPVVGDNRSYASARAGLDYKWQFSKTAAFTNELATTTT